MNAHDVDGEVGVRYVVRQRIATITIERPSRRNAVDFATAEALVFAFECFDADDGADVAILYGAGGTFCAGADLKALAAGTSNRVEPEGHGPMGPTRMLLSKPVIAAIDGYAVAGGLELALWCDLRVLANDARLGVFCRRLGVPLIDGGTIRLPRLIGHGRAMDLILTGRAVGADEALAIGLVNRLAPPGGSYDVACELARQLAKFPQLCLRGDRLSTIEQWDLDLDEALRNELGRGRATIASGETSAGASDFAGGSARHGTERS